MGEGSVLALGLVALIVVVGLLHLALRRRSQGLAIAAAVVAVVVLVSPFVF